MKIGDRGFIWIWIVILLILVTVLAVNPMAQKYKQYQKAVSLYNAGEYDTAQELFETLGGYRDAAEMETECRYHFAGKLLDEKQIERALPLYKELGDYKDSKNKITECRYQLACQLQEEKKFEEAVSAFQRLDGYSDCKQKLQETNYLWAQQLLEKKQYDDAMSLFLKLGDYKDSKKYVNECKKGQLSDTLRGTWISDGDEMDEVLALEKKKIKWVVDKFSVTTIEEPTALKLVNESDKSFKMITELKINKDGSFLWNLSESMLSELQSAKKEINQKTQRAMYERYYFTETRELNDNGKGLLKAMLAPSPENSTINIAETFAQLEMSEAEQFEFLFLSDYLFEQGAKSEIEELQSQYNHSGKYKIEGEDLIFWENGLTIRCKLSETGTTLTGIIESENNPEIHNKEVVFHRA